MNTDNRNPLENTLKEMSDPVSKSSKIEIALNDQTNSLRELCELFPSDEINAAEALEKINEYFSHNDRFLYSEISGFIYKLNEQEQLSFLQNIRSVLLIAKDNKYYLNILKLYDHVNLAINQLSNLKQSEEEFNSRFAELFKQKIEPIVDGVQKKAHDEIQGESKGIINQLISIVSIFTAIAFIVFGGITSLNNIFRGINKAPILKLCILGSIWGLCLLNLIALFMYFIFKLVKSDEKGIIRNDKVIRTGNIILFLVLVISSTLYFVINYNGSWFRDWIMKNANCTIVVITISITVIFFGVLQSIIDHYKKKKTD